MTAPTDAAAATAEFDEARAEEFGNRLFTIYTDAITSLMIDLADRTGLLTTLAEGAGTSEQLADRAGLQERYVRECLGALATAEIVEYDAGSRVFTFPAEHAACLTGDGSSNIASVAQLPTLLAQHVAGVAESFRTGGGVPYETFRPEFTTVMDALSRNLMDGVLLDGVLPLDPTLPDRLSAGMRVADIGCGTGHAVNLMARKFPASQFVGYDFSAEAIDAARTEAAEMGLSNAHFEVRDVVDLPAEAFEVVFAFDAIHDQCDPAGVLRAIRSALTPGGQFVMMDIKADSALERNVGNPVAPFLYGVSTLHCLTVSLALDGAGLGTMWGEQTARQMLVEAGFTVDGVHDVPDDPMGSVFHARRDMA